MAASFEELDQLSSHELRRRAIKLAERRLDLKFFWKLLEMIPAAQEAAGSPDKLSADVESTRLWLEEYLHPDDPLEDALRPVFIDYLQTHGG